MHRVRETLPLPEGPGGASNIYGSPEGQQRLEYVAIIQVETETIRLFFSFKVHKDKLKMVRISCIITHLVFSRSRRHELPVKKSTDVETVPRRSRNSLDDDSDSVRDSENTHTRSTCEIFLFCIPSLS